MKKYLISLLLVGIAFPCAFAQQISLTFFSGYTFAEKFEADEIYGRIDDGYQWGIGIENAFNAENAIEVNYQNMVSGVWYRRIFTQYEGDLSTNYLMAGYMRKARFQDNFYGFGVMQADAVWFIPDRSLASDEVVRPAFGARAGFRFQPTSHVALNAHAQLLSPIQWFGLDFFLGIGGPNAGVSGGSTISSLTWADR